MKSNSSNDPLDRAFEAIYADLKQRARIHLSHLPHGETLTPTALVSEAYLKLAQAQEIKVSSREHFFALAAKAMRQIVFDYARASLTQKRGGDVQVVTLDLNQASAAHSAEELIDLERALSELERLSPQQAKLVELKVFTGLSVDSIAELLNVTPRSAWREWKRARAYLLVKLNWA